MKTLKKIHTALFALLVSLTVLPVDFVESKNFIEVDTFQFLPKSHPYVEEFAGKDILGENFFLDKSPEEEDESEDNKDSQAAWVPKGGHDGHVDVKCSPFLFEREYGLLSTNLQREKKLRDYFKKCGESLSYDKSKGLFAILKMVRTKYDIFSRKDIKPFRLKLKGGSFVTEGIIAVKEGDTPRPWIIARCGMTCRGGSAGSTRAFLMHLFDEGPFNVMLFGSHTGGNIAKLNHRVMAGGFYEGHEIMAIGHWLKTQSSFKNSVSSLHVLGNSHGGHSSLFVSLYNSQNLLQGTPVFNSVVSYCPAVQLQASVNDIFQNGIRGKAVANSIWQEIKYAYPEIPYVHDIVDIDEKLKVEEVPGFIETASVRYLSKIDPQKFLQPFTGKPVNTGQVFWENNNFLSFYKKAKTPTLVVGSDNDYLIDSKFGMHLLQKQNDKERNDSLQVVTVDYGSHCAAGISYGWQAISSIMRAFFIDHSPLLKNKKKMHVVNMDFSKLRLSPSFKHVNQKWKVFPNSNKVEIAFKVWFPRNFLCRGKGPLKSPVSCYEERSLSFPRQDLPRELFGHLKIPVNDAEAEGQTRWLNSNVTIESDKGLLLNTWAKPKKISWVDYR